MPEIKIGALTAGIPLGYAEFAQALNAWSVHADIECVNRDFVADAHRRGMKFLVFTVNDRIKEVQGLAPHTRDQLDNNKRYLEYGEYAKYREKIILNTGA